MIRPELSIVSPVFCAESIVESLAGQIVEHAARVTADFEIILVDDASPDSSWTCILNASKKDTRVRGIRLSRNFGQHRAISAGLANAQGSMVIVMDCDLQDDPSYIPALVAKARDGYDVVLASRSSRSHSFFRNVFAEIFFRVFNALTEQKPLNSHVSGYSLVTRKVVDSFNRIGDVHRHYLLILGWMGFNTTTVPVEHRKRRSGRSTYNVRRLMRHAIEGITSQSTRLLLISVGVGFLYFLLSVIGVIYLVVGYYLHGFRAGWASTFVLLLGSTGLTLMAVGVLGIYVGNIFDQVRTRPLYLIQDQANFSETPR